MTFPANVMSLATAAGANFLSVAFGGSVAMSTGLNTIIAHVIATQKKLGTGSVTAPARGQALIAMGTADGDTNQQSTWDTIGRKNLLLNGSFRVQQLGTLGTTDNSHILDGWRLLLEAATAAAAAQETSDVPTDGAKYGCRLTVGSGEDNKFGIVQAIAAIDCTHLRGKQVSLQAKLKATTAITDVRMAVIEFTGTADTGVAGVDLISSWGSAGTNPTLAASFAYLGTPANLSPTTSWATYYAEGLTVGASANNLLVMIWCEDETTTVTTDVLRITDVQLEEGAVCTSVERQPFSDELNWAQYRWQQSYSYGVAAGTAVTAGSHYVLTSDNTTSKFVVVPVRFHVSMRASPTIVVYDLAGASAVITTLNAAGSQTNGVSPSIGVSGTSRDQFTMLHQGSVAGEVFHWTADSRM